MKRLTALAVAGSALVLSGCISLLPKSDPAQLYRFGKPAASLTGAPAADRVPVSIRPPEFPQAARGDRLLAVTGTEVAYLAESRWAAPAETLFAEALERTFEERAQRARLVGRRDVESGRMALDVDVRAFETRYENGPEAAPVVVVGLRARLLRYPERTVVGEQLIEARRPASVNRVGAIVQAYDAATDEALSQLVAWTDRTVAAPR